MHSQICFIYRKYDLFQLKKNDLRPEVSLFLKKFFLLLSLVLLIFIKKVFCFLFSPLRKINFSARLLPGELTNQRSETFSLAFR